MLHTVNSELCLIIALHGCTLFHMYLRCLFALEVIAKFICNVKQCRIQNNTETTDGNEVWSHKPYTEPEEKELTWQQNACLFQKLRFIKWSCSLCFINEYSQTWKKCPSGRRWNDVSGKTMFGSEGKENSASHDRDLAGSVRLFTEKPIWAKLGQVPSLLPGAWEQRRGSRSMSAPIHFASGTARERQRLLGRHRHGWKDLDKQRLGERKKWVERKRGGFTIMFQTTQTEAAAMSENHHIFVPAAPYFNDQFSSAAASLFY